MRIAKWVKRRLTVLFRPVSAERELDDEIRFHIDRETQAHMAAGVPPAEARRRALAAFGGVERMKEEVRDVRGARYIDDLRRDAAVALRGFGRQPAFLLTVLLTLGLGIGGNVAMFGLLESVLLRPLPYASPEQLVLGRVTRGGEPGNTVSAPDYYDVREQARSFAALSAFTPFQVQATLTGGGDAERVRAPYGAWDLFLTLGIDPVVGRHFRPEEGEPGGEPVVMLTHGFWQRRFGGDASVVGTTLVIDGTPTTVAGVLPERFRFPIEADVWRPMVRGGPFAQARQFHNFVMIGRLGTGVSVAAAQAEVDGIAARLAELHPESNRDKGVYFMPLHEALVANYRTMLYLLAGAVVVLLLVASANVAGILMARGNARGAEMAVRSVMGAGRSRLARQLMTENVLLAIGGTAVGLLLARFLHRALAAFLPLGLLGGVDTSLSVVTLLAAACLTLLALALFGVLPALRTARAEPARGLASGGARAGGSREAARFRSVLVVAQVAMTVALLIVAGLLLRSHALLRSVDPGFDTADLLTAEVHLPPAKYEDPSRRPAFYEELQRRIRELPGVEAVGVVNQLPVRDPGNNVRVVPIETWADGSAGGFAYQRMVLPGYFDAMGIPVLAGRDVAATDVRTGPPVVVLGESLAERLFPDGSPLGRVLGVDVGMDEPFRVEVVGVVGDIAPEALEGGSDVMMYFAYGQRSPASMRIAVRTRGEASALAGAIRGVVRDLDSDVPLAGIATMDEVLAESVAGRRAVMLALGAFAAVALLLSAVGLYGVLAYHVSRRVREIGVRMALGATVTSVSGDVLRSGLRLVAAGVLIGVPASLFATRFVGGMLYGVETTDPLTLAGVPLFFAAVALIACLLPARRAARIQPARAFRAE